MPDYINHVGTPQHPYRDSFRLLLGSQLEKRTLPTHKEPLPTHKEPLATHKEPLPTHNQNTAITTAPQGSTAPGLLHTQGTQRQLLRVHANATTNNVWKSAAHPQVFTLVAVTRCHCFQMISRHHCKGALFHPPSSPSASALNPT